MSRPPKAKGCPDLDTHRQDPDTTCPDPNTSKPEQMQIVTRRVADLIPYARNARTHSDAQVAQIAASIKEFGFTNPVLTHGDGILAGHGRVLSALKLGMATVPTIDLSHLTKMQARAYILADNQLSLNAGWEAEMLALELTELDAEGFDLDLLGFDDVAGLMNPDEAEKPKDTASQLGGLEYKLIIVCRDEQEQSDLLNRLEGEGLKCLVLMS